VKAVDDLRSQQNPRRKPTLASAWAKATERHLEAIKA